MISLSQIRGFMSMIKHYVAMGRIVGLDDMFAATFPNSLVQNAKKLNEAEILSMPRDRNTNKKIFKRLCNRRKWYRPRQWIETIKDLLINLWVSLLSNFIIIVFTYFGPIFVVGLQLFGYW